MKSLGTSILALAAVALLAAPTVSANTTPVVQSNTAAQADDTTLTTRIDAKLDASASLKKYDIDVAVKNGVVTLTGTVRTEAERLRAGRDARVPGVTRVDNKITLDKNAGVATTADKIADKTKSATATAADKTKEGLATATDKTKDALVIAAEKTKDALVTAADKTKAGLSKTGEVMTDAWITTKVHAKFVDEDVLKGSDINVDTKDHVVTLKGTVKTEAGRARAIAIAKGSEGVTKVVDQLTIK